VIQAIDAATASFPSLYVAAVESDYQVVDFIPEFLCDNAVTMKDTTEFGDDFR
jgi:hypothetical protein